MTSRRGTGKGGWGTLELWQGLAGQLSLSEAVYLNNQRILYRLQQENPRLLQLACLDESPDSEKNRPLTEEIGKAPKAQQRDQFGMMYDRDALVLYGDPLWDARFDPALQQSPVTWQWDESAAGGLTLTVTAARNYSSRLSPCCCRIGSSISGCRPARNSTQSPMISSC